MVEYYTAVKMNELFFFWLTRINYRNMLSEMYTKNVFYPNERQY